jgi:hypothetical protein
MEQALIHKQIAKVMADMGPIAKDRKNVQQGYKFRGIDELMNAFAPAATKHGIYPTVTKIEDITDQGITSKSGGAGYRVVRRYTFRFTAEDGSYSETMADGEAIDYGDKASNKAYSVAYREAIFKMFVIPFENEEIEDSDHNLAPPAAKPVPPKKVEDKRTVQKARIKELIDGISLVPLTTGLEYREYVRNNFDLELEPQNYTAIVARLEALQSAALEE